MRVRPQPNRPACRLAAAFTLIEMLITLALILILFVMMYGFGSRSHQQQQKLVCQKNLTTIHVALEIFANEHDGAFPLKTDAATSEAALAQLVPKYTAATEPFICPGSKDKPIPEGESFEDRRISYAYYMGQRLGSSGELLMSDQQVDALPKIKGQAVFSTNGKRPGNNHHRYGGNLLYCDGRVEKISAIAPFSLLATQGVVLLNPKQP
jgi:prepilin-type N-terminal cleavage/methylation domain-containing protein